MSNNSPVFTRAIAVAVGGITVIAGLWLVVWLAPAFRPLVAPLYWIVAAAVIVVIWQVTRPRATKDRRQEDRRER